MNHSLMRRSVVTVTGITGWTAAIACLVIGGCNSGSRGGGGGGTLPPPPTIASVSPNQGILGGGTLVNITLNGANFGPNAAASFGANAATVVSNTSTNVLTVRTPAATATGLVDVTVWTDGPGSTAAVATGAFSYQSMVVTGVNPNTGPVTGGIPVVITGEGFQNVTGVSILTTFNVDSPTQISGTLAANPTAGPVDVVVSSTSGTATLQGGFSYTPGGGGNLLIGIVSLDVNVGIQAGGTLVTITGFGFEPGSTQTVRFGANQATIVGTPTTTTISVQTPAATSPGPVAVTVNTPTNGAATLPAAFTYISPGTPPTVASVAPTSGPESGGTNVTITGSGFLGADLATIASTVLNMKVVNDSTIVGVTAPMDAGNGVAPQSKQVTVQTPFGTSSQAVNFTYTPSLFLTQVTPNQGPRSGGTTVKIFGRNFLTGATPNVTAVAFNGVNGTFLTILSATELDVTTPPGSIEGAVQVVIKGQNGFADAAVNYAFIYGEIFGVPTLPNQDSLDLAGDLFGSQGAATAAQNTIANIGSTAAARSKVASGDISVYEGEFVAVTLPLNNSVYVSGGTVSENVLQGSLITVTKNLTEGNFALAATPTDLVWTDANGDGTPDVVLALSNGSIQLIRLAGSGNAVTGATLVPAIAGGGAGAATGIGTADVNGDGRFDVVTVRGTAVDVFLNNGAGSYAAGVALPVPVKATVKLVACDPNGVANLSMDPELHQALIDRLPGELRFDINRDGKSDIVLLHTDGTMTVLFGDGTGQFDNSLTVGAGSPLQNPVDFALNDLTGDRRADLAVLTGQNMAIFKTTVNKAVGTTSVAQIQTITFPAGASPATPTGITLVDADNDCSPDLVVSNMNVGGPNVSLWLNKGDLSFSGPTLYAAQAQPNMSASFMSLDVASSRRRAVWTASDFGTPVPSAVPNALKSLVEIDRELLSFFTGNAPTILSGPLPVGTDPRALRFGDLDDDGKNDVVVCNFGANSLSIRLGNGDGTFGPQFNVATGVGPESLALGDVDLDGDLDVVVCNNLNGAQPFDQITVHLNTGNGTFGAGVTYNSGGRGARDIRLADVNNDGDLDAVVVHQTSNNVAVLLAGANATFGAPSLYGVGNRPLSVVVADMGTPEGANATTALQPDGLPDLVVANSGDDTVSVVYNGFTPTGVAPAGTSFGRGEAYPLGGSIQPNVTQFITNPPSPNLVRTNVEPRGVAVIDLNMDGALDIVTVDQGTNTISILHANLGNRPTDPIKSFYPNPVHITPGATICNSMNIRLGINDTLAIGGMNSPTAVRKWFIPRDYRYQGGLTDIGRPQVVIAVGTNPQFISVADMNVDGRPDLVVGAFGSSDITILINAGTDTQNGPNGPPSFVLGAPCNGIPPGFPGYMPHSQVIESPAIGEVFFRSPRIDLTNPATLPGYSPNSGTATTFVVPVGGPVTGMDVDRVDDDCPPDPGVVLSNQTLRIQRGE